MANATKASENGIESYIELKFLMMHCLPASFSSGSYLFRFFVCLIDGLMSLLNMPLYFVKSVSLRYLLEV